MMRLKALPRSLWGEESDEDEDETWRASGTRRVVARADQPAPPPAESPPQRTALEPERELPLADRPTLPVPRFELLDGGGNGAGIYASILDTTGAPDSGRDESPTVPAPAYVDALRRGTDAARSAPPSRTPPSFRELGSLQRVPHLTCSPDELRASPLDHKQAFVLVLVDGHLDIETILDATPMPMHDVLRILLDLKALGLIALD